MASPCTPGPDARKIVAAIVARRYISAPQLIMGRSEIAFDGESVLAIIARRLRRCESIGQLVLATSPHADDDSVAAEGERLGLPVFRCAPDNVLERLACVCRDTGADHVVKVNGNYPLVCPEVADAAVQAHLAGGCDFCFTEHVRGVPLGTGVSVISEQALRRLDPARLGERERTKAEYQFLEHPDDFKVCKPPFPDPRPQYRVDLSEPADRVVIAEILKASPDPSLRDIIAFLDKDPILARSNLGLSHRPEVGTEKLLLFPEKIRGILDAAPVDQSYPVSVELSLTNRCNADCMWCSDRDLRRRQGDGEMEVPRFRALFKDLQEGGTRGIVFEGGGEPTLHPAFPELVDYAVSLGLKAGLITNGIDLHGVDPSKFEWIRVSLDAATRETYRKLKRVDRFDDVLRNLRVIGASSTILGIGYLVSDQNMEYAELEELLIQLKGMGARYIHFRPIVDHPELAPRPDAVLGLNKLNSPGFSVLNSAMLENVITGNMGLPCLAHSMSSVVTANGDVFLCGRLNIHRWCAPIGNLKTRAFRDLWHGEERQRQALQVRDPDFCLNHCPKCRISKFNVLFHQVTNLGTKNFI